MGDENCHVGGVGKGGEGLIGFIGKIREDRRQENGGWGIRLIGHLVDRGERGGLLSLEL